MTGAAPPRRLLHVFSTFAVGGPQMRFAAIANRLNGKYRHLVVAMDGNHAAATRLDPGVDIELVPVAVAKGRLLGNLPALRRRLRDIAPDLLLTYNWGAIEWALANRLRPLVRHVHLEDGFGPEESPAHQLPRRVLTRRLALGRSAAVVVPSRTLERLARERWRLEHARLRYIPNGIDVERFAAPGDPEALPPSFRANGPLIGTVAALRPEKNLARLLRAFASLGAASPARLVIVGGGSEGPALEGLAGTLGIAERVLFTGPIERPERLLGLFDIFAVSSDTEQMPLSLLEAMAAGLPVAAVDVGDIAVMVDAANQPYIAPAGDEAGLTQALAALLAAPERRREIGARNRDKARRDYGQAAMVEAYDRLYSL